MKVDVGAIRVELTDRCRDVLGDVDLARSDGAVDAEGDDLLAVEARALPRLLPAVLHRAEIGEADRLARGQRDAGVPQGIERGRASDGADGLLAVADRGAATGLVDVRIGQRLARFGYRDAEGGEAVGIELDGDDAIDPARAGDLRDAVDLEQGLADIVVDEPAELVG